MAGLPETPNGIELTSTQQLYLAGAALAVGASIAGAFLTLWNSERGRELLKAAGEETKQVGKETWDEVVELLKAEGPHIAQRAGERFMNRVVKPFGEELFAELRRGTPAFQHALEFAERMTRQHVSLDQFVDSD